ncbi:prenyltransferase/squalene oxidase repeat-containing protein [Streptomyces indicus]|uniref:Prenyltransferase and squalene oxidase repeat-containing protein n=1 Tax=Streptomyces indicus TaxID=417292 RepID=A0A1G8YFB7_9ACTN|nr:prenyltransferase/squalene oxidase repeat-containing protein [Streptomyces indicus]SDK01639.1 Prenyltransferase and squalene oxidase repeat-containing protein [Streptomyces indicus]
MNARRSAAALAATAVLCMAAAPAATADTPAPANLPSGLYGKTDPKYDGVFRQSYALLAQHTAGVKPAAKAVDWLTGQACDNGSYAAFREDPSQKCDAKTVVDSNSTASAIQALAALGGHDADVKKSVDWLRTVQNEDGGWGYNPGLDSDANSTSLVIGALKAAGENPAEVKSQKGKAPADALVALSMPCDDKGKGAFGLADMKTGKLAPNADATAAGVLGGLEQGLVVKAADKSEPAQCAEAGDAKQAAANGAAYLADTLAKDGFLKSSMPGAEDQPDYGNTADSVVALSAAGLTEQAKKPLAELEKNGAAWAKTSGSPAAYSQLIFAAHAAGADPKDFGGTDLVSALNAMGPAPQKADSADATKDADEEKKDDSSSMNVWWIIGVFFIASVGVGFLFSGRKKNQL